MIPYLICLLPALFAGIFAKCNNAPLYKGNVKPPQKWTLIFLLPLGFLLAFKGVSVGADTENYNRLYQAMCIGKFEIEYERVEIGYRWFLRLLTKLSDEPQVQYIVYALLFIASLYFFTKKYSVNPARFVVMFLGLNLFAFYMTGIRQSIAMLICLFSYEFIKNKKPFRFLLIVTLGVLFHKSAIFFYPAYFFANWRRSKAKIPLFFVIFGLFALFNETLFSTAGEIFDVQYGIEKTDNGYFMILLMAFVTILSFLRIHKLTQLDPNNMTLIQMNIMHMGFWLLRFFSRTAERPTMFYTCFTILLIEQLILTIESDKDRFVANVGTMLFFGVYFIYKILGSGLVPYVFCW